MKRIPVEIRSCVRFFAYFVGNGTLGAAFNEFPEYDHLFHEASFLPSLVAVFVNRLDINDLESIGPAQRTAWEFVRSRLADGSPAEADPGMFDMNPKRQDDYRQVLCAFAQHLAIETIPRSHAKGFDYWTSGSGLELMFAVYCNVSELDAGSRVSNHEFAWGRVDLMVDSDDVALDDWEMELH